MGEGPKDVRNDADTDPRTRGEEFTSRSTSDLTGRPVEDFNRPGATDGVVGYQATPGPLTASIAQSSGTTEGGATEPSADANRDTTEIRSEIERTRNNISETVDAIQQRLSPGNIMNEARETVRQKTRQRARQVADAASEAASQVSERTREVAGQVADKTRRVSNQAVSRARENPWVAVASVAGVGAAAWFLMGRRRHDDDYDDVEDLDEFTEESLYYDEFDVDDDEGRSWRRAGPAMPLVIAGAGLGYYLWRRQDRGRSGYSTEAFESWSDDSGYGADAGSYQSFDESREGWGEQTSDTAEKMRGAAERARGAVRSATDRARGAMSSAGDRARGVVSSAGDRARTVVSSAGSRARGAVDDASERGRMLASRASRQIGTAGRRARTQLEHWLDTNPLAVGAAALLVGVVVGLALPETERERNMLGPARDKVMDRAQQMASSAVERAKQTAKDTVHQVAEKASAAMHEAGSQNQPGRQS